MFLKLVKCSEFEGKKSKLERFSNLSKVVLHRCVYFVLKQQKVNFFFCLTTVDSLCLAVSIHVSQFCLCFTFVLVLCVEEAWNHFVCHHPKQNNEEVFTHSSLSEVLIVACEASICTNVTCLVPTFVSLSATGVTPSLWAVFCKMLEQHYSPMGGWVK